MITGIKMKTVKRTCAIICTLSIFLCYGDDNIKHLIVEETELLCRTDADIVDTISFSSISDSKVASGSDFLDRLDRILKIMQGKNIRIASEMRLYLGCKLPLEMKQTMYQVVSEHYAKQFARGNYLISSSGRGYAHKLIGRGFFLDIDQVLFRHGYKINSVFLEKVVINRDVKQAFAFTDITLTKMVSHRADSSTYAMLTNKLSQCIADGNWRYETNGFVCTRKITLPVKIDSQFSEEIIASLKKCCPQEWNDAISLSGNAANPNMMPLRPYFNNAVLHTPTITMFQLAARNMMGQDVTLRVYHEKLSYTTTDIDKPNLGNRIIRCFLWVEVGDNCSESILLSSLRKILLKEKGNSAIDSCVILFHAEVFLSDDILQNELQTLLKKVHPNEMDAALKSSGNVHNPKLSFLYSALRPAIRDTPSMQKLSRIAQSYGYEGTIPSLGGEKLQFRRKDLNGAMFENPEQRIFGIFGFSARKSGWETKPNLRARIVDVDAKGSVLADEIKIISKPHYWRAAP